MDTDFIPAPSDSAISREDLHDFLCVGDLSGLLLPGKPDPGCSGHGLRGAEPGNYRWGLAKGERVSAGYGASSKRTTSRCNTNSLRPVSYFNVSLCFRIQNKTLFLFAVGSKETSTGDRLSVVARVVSILCENRKYTTKQQQKKKISQDVVWGNSPGTGWREARPARWANGTAVVVTPNSLGYSPPQDLIHPLCLYSLPHLLCQSTPCWPRSLLTPLAPEEEARSASSALSGHASTLRLTLTTSTAFMGTPSGVAPTQR